MIQPLRLRRDERGNATIEFALFAPTLLLIIFGVIQMGVLFLASAGLNHAVAEGARHATLYRPGVARSTMTTEIQNVITARRFGGLRAAGLRTPVLTYGTDAGLDYVDVSLSYQVQLEFVFMQVPAFTITRTRRAFLV